VTVFLFFREENRKLGSATVFSPKFLSPAAGGLTKSEKTDLNDRILPKIVSPAAG
jgi:hypothetical protein